MTDKSQSKSYYCVHTFKSHYTPFCPPHLLSIARPSQITQEVQRCLGHGYDLFLNLHIEASPAADWSRGCCCDNSCFRLQTANGNVEAKVVCFYRRRDISTTLITLADKHARE